MHVQRMQSQHDSQTIWKRILAGELTEGVTPALNTRRAVLRAGSASIGHMPAFAMCATARPDVEHGSSELIGVTGAQLLLKTRPAEALGFQKVHKLAEQQKVLSIECYVVPARCRTSKHAAVASQNRYQSQNLRKGLRD